MHLQQADIPLLQARESEVLNARYFRSESRQDLMERLEIFTWDMATCWRNLEELCELYKDMEYINEFKFAYATRIVEGLGRFGQDCEEKVLELLRLEIEDVSHHQMGWLEPLAVRLAGRLRLESAIPLIIKKLHEDGDVLCEECSEALIRIGTPARAAA